jgi:Domain of unknown function (DUF4124)/Penicillin-Binding Protein C-terminus Family
MHLRRLWIALPLLAAVTAGAGAIYKWTDADGVVHYSDQATPGAEKIEITTGSANGVGGATRAPSTAQPQKTPESAQTLSIESPANEQVFFGDDIVPVRMHADPSLRPDQSVVWHLNGKQLDDQPPTATSFTLQSLPRGTYAIAATVTDAAGQSQSTNSVTFYVRQPSELGPQHKKS